MAYTPNWISEDQTLGQTRPGYTDSEAKVPLGSVIRYRDVRLGVGEFIYLLGVASTVAGDVVTYLVSDGNSLLGTTARWGGTVITANPVAIATAAVTAGLYGWYQIEGSALINTSGTVAAGDKAFYSGTTAVIGTTQVNGKQLLGTSAASANGTPNTAQAVYTIDRPSVQGQVV